MRDIDFNKYQEFTRSTAIYNKEAAIPYTTLGLCGEAGEVADKIKKIVRDDDCVLTEEKRAALCKELGDVLWYLARLADELGLSLEEVAQSNIEKLTKRKEEGKIGGSGDNR